MLYFIELETNMSKISKHTLICIPCSNKIKYDVKHLEKSISLKKLVIPYALSKIGMFIQERHQWYSINTKCLTNTELEIKNEPVFANYIEENKYPVFHLPLDTIFMNKTLYRFQNDILELRIEERNDNNAMNKFPNQYKQEQNLNICLKLKSDYHDLNIKEMNEISRVLSLIKYI